MDESQIKQIWNEHSKGYDQKHVSADGMGEYTRIFSEKLGKEPKDILDIGTGTGFLALLLAKMGHRSTGIDLAEKMLKMAEEKAVLQNLPVRFVEGSWDKLLFEDESFDAVVNRCVMWMLFFPECALAEWKRVLRPGGRILGFCFHDANGVIPNHYDEETEARLPLKRLPPQEMVKVLERSGFTEVHATTLDGVPANENFPAWYLLEGIKPG